MLSAKEEEAIWTVLDPKMELFCERHMFEMFIEGVDQRACDIVTLSMMRRKHVDRTELFGYRYMKIEQVGGVHPRRMTAFH